MLTGFIPLFYDWPRGTLPMLFRLLQLQLPKSTSLPEQEEAQHSRISPSPRSKQVAAAASGPSPCTRGG